MPASNSIADYSPAQQLALANLQPVIYCSNPEDYLSEAAETYFPPPPEQDDDARHGYSIRLSRAMTTFEPWYRALRELAVGSALHKPIERQAETSEVWQRFLDDCTMEGHSITAFSRLLLTAALDGGWAGVLIDYPPVPTGLNLAQERALGLRPYFVLIPRSRVLGWKSETIPVVVNGEQPQGRPGL